MPHVAKLTILCLAVLALSLPAAAQDDLITFGDIVTGTLDDAIPEQPYSFEATAGQVITIAHSATSGDLDPLLILQDANGAVLTQDDDSGGNRNALIRDFTIPADGAYTVIATRYDRDLGATSGDFALALLEGEGVEVPAMAAVEAVEAAPPAEEAAEPAAEPETEPEAEAAEDPFGPLPELGDSGIDYAVMTYGDSLNGEITEEAWAVAYAFGGSAGDTVAIQVNRTGGDLVPNIALFDRSGENTLAEVVGGEHGTAMLSYTLPETSYYVVGVRRENAAEGTSAGTYAIRLVGPVVVDVALSWETEADIDLVLYYPSDEEDAQSISWENPFYERSLPTGVAIAGDGNGFCRELVETPSERIVWDESAPSGNYEVLVLHSFGCESPVDPVPFELNITINGETQTLTGEVGAPDGEYRAAFAY